MKVKPGDLLRVNIFSPKDYKVVTYVGVVLEVPEERGLAKLLCSSGELKEFLVGYGGYEVIG